MILTVPCNHPYFLDFLKNEVKSEINFELYPDENNFPMAFLYLNEMNGYNISGCSILMSAKTRRLTHSDYLENNNPWVMGLFVKESERNHNIGKVIMYALLNKNSHHIAHKLIIDYNMPVSTEDINIIQSSCIELLDVINTRDLYHKMNDDLSENQNKVKKIKI